MQKAGLSPIAINSFQRLYQLWESNEDNTISEDSVLPMDKIPCIADIAPSLNGKKYSIEALTQTAFLKLNGGLGTSMGLSKAKSLLPVVFDKGRHLRFIDIIIGQISAARTHYGVSLPLIFMNSYRTDRDTHAVLEKRKTFTNDGIDMEIMQHKEPKICLDTGEPVQWEKQPLFEWCPPGHGDLFASLAESHLLDQLMEKNIRYLFISNTDNLGARPSPTVAGYFAQTGAPFMAEVARKTVNDVKGGHFVRDKKTGRLLLREMSQIRKADEQRALDPHRHPFFNTNNIWLRVDALQELLRKKKGILNLPLIANEKTADATDPTSTPVVQLETAMGAAIAEFDGGICVEVDRRRFLPVKTTSDLFIMRSNRFHLTNNYEMEDGNYIFPQIFLDNRYYKYIDDFDQRFPYGIPSIAAANSVTVQGNWTFGKNVSFYADALLEEQKKASYVPDGQFVGPHGIEDDDWA